MSEIPGILIALEGIDGTGKTVQLKLLAERLKAVGYKTVVYDFPRYSLPSSYFAKSYLEGRYGGVNDVSPYVATMFYSLDRYDASDEIRKDLEAGKIVLTNRFSGSNLAHKGSKFSSSAERRGFFIWADNLEHEMLGVPRPTINICLQANVENSKKRIEQRNIGNRPAKDVHESDNDHLTQAETSYRLLCELFPRNFINVPGQDLDITSVSNLVWDVVRPLLPQMVAGSAKPVTLDLNSLTSDKPLMATAKAEADSSSADLSLIVAAYNLPRIDQISELPKKTVVFDEPADLAMPQLSEYRDLMSKLLAKRREFLRLLNKASRHSKAQNQAKKLAEVANLTLPLATKLKYRLKFKLVSADSKLMHLIGNLTDQMISVDTEKVRISEIKPRNELDIVSNNLSRYGQQSQAEVADLVDNWPYDQKIKALGRLIKTDSQAVLQGVGYRLELLTTSLTVSQLIRSGGIKRVIPQPPTPRYGYDIPEIVEELGLADGYSELFDESLAAYSELQATGNNKAAEYLVLQGHLRRWQIDLPATELFVSQLHGPTWEPIIQQLADIHPNLIKLALQNGQKSNARTLARKSRK